MVISITVTVNLNHTDGNINHKEEEFFTVAQRSSVLSIFSSSYVGDIHWLMSIMCCLYMTTTIALS